MSRKETIRLLKKYKTSPHSGRLRERYLQGFVPKMIYRTTKTEHMEATRQTVNEILNAKT